MDPRNQVTCWWNQKPITPANHNSRGCETFQYKRKLIEEGQRLSGFQEVHQIGKSWTRHWSKIGDTGLRINNRKILEKGIF